MNLNPNQITILMDTFGIKSMDEITIIKWEPSSVQPMEESRVLLRFDDTDAEETVVEPAVYSNGIFEQQTENGAWMEIPLEQVHGWVYPISEPTWR